MDSEQLAKLELVLTEACDKAIASGLSISDGLFVDAGDEQVCPIGAACMPLPEEGTVRYEYLLSLKLGFLITNNEMWSFIDGFDVRDAAPLERQNPQLFALGVKFRKKYIATGK